MPTLPTHDLLAKAVTTAIQSGDVPNLHHLLRTVPDLAVTRIVDDKGVGRTLLHIATDWPGHFPNAPQTIAALIAAGADADAGVSNPDQKHPETPLHWAASSNDVAAIDALLDGGAGIETPGAVFTGGTAMSDAVVFAQWTAARRLLERGARTTIWQAAALGLLDHVLAHAKAKPAPTPQQITNAFWHACRAGQQNTAELLLALGADINWIGYGQNTPLYAAQEAGHTDLVAWMRSRGARTAEELG